MQDKTSNSTANRLWQYLTSFKSALYYKRHLQSENINVLRQVITQAERGHRGEIRLVIEHKLSLSLILNKITSRQRAVQLFSDLRMWDTQGNTGILIYLLLNEKKIEIVADRGIAEQVPQDQWNAICRQLQNQLAAEHVVDGLSETLQQCGSLLREHFPHVQNENNPDELSNIPIIII
jgi:uncharacterized membrane protein